MFEFSSYPHPAGGAVLWGRAEEGRKPTSPMSQPEQGWTSLSGTDLLRFSVSPRTETPINHNLSTQPVAVFHHPRCKKNGSFVLEFSISWVSRQCRFPGTGIWRGNNYMFSTLFSSKHMSSTYLVPVQCNGSKGQHRHVDRAVLNKPADVTHQLPKNPGAAHKPHLKNRQQSD